MMINKWKKYFQLYSAPFRKMPDFIIIGAQKCGTSSLHYYLSQHPHVKMSVPKEIHFFDQNFTKSIWWYKSHFPFKLDKRKSICGEATPYYFFHPLVPKRIYKLCPKVKLILLLRNPVDRAYSHYIMQKIKGIENCQTFEEAIAIEEFRIKDDKEKILKDRLYKEYNFQKFSYLERGKYFDQLKRWLKYFSVDQILIIKSEDFFSEPNCELAKIYNFLSIEEIYPKDLSIINSNEYDEISRELRERLNIFFKEVNKDLIEILGEKYTW